MIRGTKEWAVAEINCSIGCPHDCRYCYARVAALDKGLIDSAAMARMTVAEAMTNLMWARISKTEDIKASGNWMYAAKLAGEGDLADGEILLRSGKKKFHKITVKTTG